MHALDVVRYGHLLVLRTLEGVGESLAEAPGACGVWSIREIMAHLASYEAWSAEVVANVADSSAPMPILARLAEQGDSFNDIEVAERSGQSLQQLVEEYTRHYETLMARMTQLPPEKFHAAGTIDWYGAEYDLDDFLLYTNYAHKREHCAQIEVVKDRQG